MAENQYIGARYVPKFFANPNGSSEWLGNVPYEPLTIVTYLGNSYTSKIPVPPGIGNPSLNPTYWVLTGNFNAQYNEVLQNIDKINGRFLFKSPEDFGAKGDGITDDTTPIQEALNSGYSVLFSPKTYKISGHLNVASNSFIHGNGCTILCEESDTGEVLGIRNNNVFIGFMNISATNLINAIGVSNAKNIYVCNVFASNCLKAVTGQQKVENMLVENCSSVNSVYGFSAEYDSYNVTFSNCSVFSCGTGFFIGGVNDIAKNCKIQSCYIYGTTGRAVYVNKASNISIDNLFVDMCNSGIYYQDADGVIKESSIVDTENFALIFYNANARITGMVVNGGTRGVSATNNSTIYVDFCNINSDTAIFSDSTSFLDVYKTTIVGSVNSLNNASFCVYTECAITGTKYTNGFTVDNESRVTLTLLEGAEVATGRLGAPVLIANRFGKRLLGSVSINVPNSTNVMEVPISVPNSNLMGYSDENNVILLLMNNAIKTIGATNKTIDLQSVLF